MTSAGFEHQPVMLTEVLEVFEPLGPGVLVDATLGGAGHSRALLEAHPTWRLVGLDRDAAAVAAATEALAPWGERAVVVQRRFDHLAEVLNELDVHDVVAVLFDLGVSSPQLDRAERGFSFRNDGPLDMRMDENDPTTAAVLVNEWPVGELASVLRRYGDERFAHRVATAIVAARPVNTTAELAEIVRSAIPAATRRTGGHPARRTFQALRIAVNDELAVLESALPQAIDALAAGGRGAVLTYHSGEDRIVKRILRSAAGLDRAGRHPNLPLPPDAPLPTVELVGRAGRTPTAGEVAANPRAGSARLRAFAKTGRSNEEGS